MQFSRARYVTLCQQSLVTAAVLAVGVSAAGVKTLDIVPQPGPVAGARETVPMVTPSQALAATREEPAKTAVDAAPVTPKVREVEVRGLARTSAQAPARTAPETTAPQSKAPETPAPSPEATAPDAPTSTRLVALSEPQPVSGYATVGVTWKHGVDYADGQIAIQIRTAQSGRWSDWMPAEYHDDHGPAAAEGGEPGERPGTDALVIGDVDQVQMRAETTDGSTPPDLQLAVIDPGEGTLVQAAPAIDTATLPSSATSASHRVTSDDGTSDAIALSAMKTAPKPYIYSRAQWGANEKMRESGPPSYGTVKAGFIHHTVNANSYTSAQVPALLRGIYAYHTQSKGWRDIGYNYLVDRFGRIWEGRYGGVDRAVVGAHTLGYNEYSFAMSAIGNFDIATPPAAVVSAYSRLFAWKLSLSGIRADAPRLYVKNRYLQAINGHRDVGQTACPGRYLYAKLGEVRSAAQKLQNAAQSGGVVTPPPPAPKPTPAPAPAPAPPATFSSPTQTPQRWTRQAAGITFPRSSNLAGSTHPDLVLKRKDGLVQVLPTGGQTGYGTAVSTAGSWSAMNLVTAVGDVTGDGKGDVIGRLRRDGSTRVYAGDGAGHVKTAGVGRTLAFRDATSIVAAGDWNRDGRPDVLMKDKANRLSLVPGKGAGSFGPATLLSRSWGAYTSTAVAGDLSGDGRSDLVAINRNGYLYVVPSTKSARLGGALKRRSTAKVYDSVAGGAADLTGDAIGDVVVRSSRTGLVAILPGLGKNLIGSKLGWFPAAAGLGGVSAGSMSGSAQPDLVGIRSGGKQLVVVPANGLVNLRPALAGNLRVPTATQVLGVGDWNRDGKGDVITREASSDQLVLRPGLGNGQFGTGRLMSKGWRTITSLAAVGDVTGDRLPDLAGKTTTGAMTIYPSNGATGFLAPLTAPSSLRTYNQVGTTAWQPLKAGSTWISSDGSFVPSGGTGGNPAGYDWLVGPGDVDGDGRADMVARDAQGTLWLLPGASAGYGSPRLIGTGFSGYSLGG